MNFLEVNVCWHRTSPWNHLEECTYGWFETLHRSVAYNYRDMQAQTHQYGGNVIFSINDAAHRVMDANRDPTGLGHWAWTKYQG